jgi:dephospho-CoA kinase
MVKVALTGNIGSGKSTVAKIFNVFGVPVFNADIEARLLYFEKEVKNQLKNIFGNKVFSSDGSVNTKILASIIFSDKQALKSVNEIIHPLVIAKYNRWCLANKTYSYTIHETAILFENGLQSNFDAIINVSAPSKIRLKRVMERDRISQSLVETRMVNQLSDELKCELSDFIINNDGSSFLIPQVEAIHHKLSI